jgi:AraC family transcriptional regulator of adaptative response / DNA-3-methyladenine glycosylase II
MSHANEELTQYLQLIARFRAEPRQLRGTTDMARSAGITEASLDALFLEHAHLTPELWLLRMKVRLAAQQLLETRLGVDEIAYEVGLRNQAELERAFLGEMRLTAQEYRALDAARGFQLELPNGYRSAGILAYQGRDPLSVSERVAGNRIWKALPTPGGPVVLELTVDSGRATVKVHAGGSVARSNMALLHTDALRILGLANEIESFEQQHAPFVKGRRGVRVSVIRGFDALSWAITGQQINLKFAATLRREMISLAGEKIGDLRAHPTPQALADRGEAALTAIRYSRSKARYLITAAEVIASGELDIDRLAEGSAVAVERQLLAQHGIGVWTARYVMMRSGFADSAPIGDSGLATALERMYELPARPDATQMAQMMSRFAPYRSLASMHLWTLLHEPGD